MNSEGQEKRYYLIEKNAPIYIKFSSNHQAQKFPKHKSIIYRSKINTFFFSTDPSLPLEFTSTEKRWSNCTASPQKDLSINWLAEKSQSIQTGK